MNLAIRIVVLLVVAGGAAAATVSSGSASIPSHQAPATALPVPGCGPGVCPPGNPNGN